MKERSCPWADTRSGQRRLAFQVLYSLAFTGSDKTESLRQTLRSFQPEEITNSDFAWELIQGVFKQLGKLDETISRYSKGWKLERIAKTELSILRLSLFEMLFLPEIPLKVAINEGVELAKHFGDENAPGYVNGLLDAVAKDVAGGKISGVSKAV